MTANFTFNKHISVLGTLIHEPASYNIYEICSYKYLFSLDQSDRQIEDKNILKYLYTHSL